MSLLSVLGVVACFRERGISSDCRPTRRPESSAYRVAAVAGLGPGTEVHPARTLRGCEVIWIDAGTRTNSLDLGAAAPAAAPRTSEG
jgi:hypothetical protein